MANSISRLKVSILGVIGLLFGLSALAVPGKIPLALTFDDLPASGPEAAEITREQAMDLILQALKKHKVPPVYGFLTGQLADNMEGRKKLLVRWKEAGHLIGNHGFSHLDLSKTNSADYIADIAKNEPLLIDYASTIKELKVFRYPFLMEGDSHDKRYAVRSYLSRRQYQIAQVSVDFQDWHFYEAWMKCQGQEDNQRQLEDEFILFAKQRLTTYHQVGQYIFGANRELPHILLLHLTPLTAKLLDRLLSEFTKMGVRWISADQAIRHPLYQEDTALEMKSGGMGFLDQALQSRKLKFKWPKNHILPKNKLLSLCP